MSVGLKLPFVLLRITADLKVADSTRVRLDEAALLHGHAADRHVSVELARRRLELVRLAGNAAPGYLRRRELWTRRRSGGRWFHQTRVGPA